MTATDRLTSERVFHDRQAAERAGVLNTASLRFNDDEFLDHESWVRPAFAALGDLRGKRALDYGCGHGMAAVTLARAGAVVTAFDLSPGYVSETCRRAAINSVTVRGVVADGEQLPFPDNSFDAIWGNAVLHHLDLDRAAAELKRVLAPGGVAVFCEPWGGNPFLSFARRRLPYPGKHRTPDEQPLRPTDLTPIQRHFPGLTITGYQLLGMAGRVWKPLGRFGALDRPLLRMAPPLKSWCRYVVLELRAS